MEVPLDLNQRGRGRTGSPLGLARGPQLTPPCLIAYLARDGVDTLLHPCSVSSGFAGFALRFSNANDAVRLYLLYSSSLPLSLSFYR